ncbi:hypothetical protein X777_11294 [Ooceraea biroi]|uniref:DUF4817 domain-containing protein n=1 Tax=Ooceraea biroi TaxID=2015173 RepID=A0A026W2P7_OOCBI|nr:hypothetical protein X777_11294 [Ooceraea biroi]
MRTYAARFLDRRHSTRKTMKLLLRRAQQGHLKRNRRKTGPKENNILVTLAAVELNPNISTRNIENEHGIPQKTRSVEYQHQWSINVWGGIIGTHVIGPHFFEGHLNRETYLRFMQNELPNLLEDVDLCTRRKILCVGVRGKGTRINQAPRREQKPTTSTPLFLGSAKNSDSPSKILGECRGNYRAAAQLYRQRFPNRYQHPADVVIARIERRERQRPPISRQCRRVSERDDPRVLVVLAMLNLNPHISVRQIERQSGIPKSTIQRIIALHGFHPYHITLTQCLMPNDFQRRLAFCNWSQTIILHDPDFFRYVMFSDEATFHNNGQLNRHNSHYWSVENPHWYREVDINIAGVLLCGLQL